MHAEPLAAPRLPSPPSGRAQSPLDKAAQVRRQAGETGFESTTIGRD
jgi:hypothetical protein